MIDLLYQFSSNTAEPPTGNQLRFDAVDPAAVTKVWVRKDTSDGIDAHRLLLTIAQGAVLYVQDKNDHTLAVAFTVAAAPVDKDSYLEFPVALRSSSATLLNNQAVLFLGDTSPQTPAPSGGGYGFVDPNALVAGQYGSHRSERLVTPPHDEPFTLDQAKLRAGLDWASGDPRDGLMTDVIKAARQTWETQTGMAVLTQTRTLTYDAVPPVLELIVKPLVSVTEVRLTLADGSLEVLDPTSYAVDLAGSRIAFTTWPTATLQPFQAWAITVVAGYPDRAAIPPDIVQAIGALLAHWSTLGRDLASIDTVAELPYGWDALIAPYRPEVLP